MAESSSVNKLIQAVEEYERDWQERLQYFEGRVRALEQEKEELHQELARQRSLLDEISDETLKSRLSKLGGFPPLDTVIREAGVVLENRLRTLDGVDGNLHGTQLVDAVFDPKTGVLQFSSHTGEQEGVRMLYRGAMQFIRNPPMHKLVEYPESTARLLIRLIDALLQLLSEGESQGKRKKWSEEEFFSVLSKNVTPSVVSVVKDLYDWGKKTADRMSLGTGAETGSITFHYLREGKTISVFTIGTNGKLALNYVWLSYRIDRESMEQFHGRITEIPAFRRIPADFSTWHSLKVADAFRSPEEVEGFKQAIIWLRDKIDADMKGKVISA